MHTHQTQSGWSGSGRTILGELINNFELFYLAYKEMPSALYSRQVSIVCPVNTVACMLTGPQYGCVWEQDKQVISRVTLHMY